MTIEFQLINILFVIFKSFIIPLILIIAGTEIIFKLYDLKIKLRNRIRKYLYISVLILLGWGTISSIYGTYAPRIVHNSAYIPDGSEKTINVIKPSKLIDSTTMETLKQQTVDQENAQNEKLKKRGVDLTN